MITTKLKRMIKYFKNPISCFIKLAINHSAKISVAKLLKSINSGRFIIYYRMLIILV